MRIDAFLWRGARLFPDRPAVVDAATSLTHAELSHQVGRLTALLLSWGLQPGDRIVMLSKNRWEYAALFHAAARMGAVVVPLNWRLRLPELRWIIADAAPAAVLAEPSFAQTIEPLRNEIESVRHWVALDEAPQGWGHLPTLMAHSPSFSEPTRALPPEAIHEPLLQIYSSGTTGRPKGAVLTHANFSAAIMAMLSDFGMKPGHDRFLQVTPLFHVGGALMALTCAAGCITLRLLPEFDPLGAAQCLSQEAVTHTLMVPAMLNWMMGTPGFDQLRFPDLRVFAYGAAPMPVPLLARAIDHMRCGFLQGYGLTETAGVLTILSPADHVLEGGVLAPPERLASAGREMLGTHIRVVDPDGHPLPVGEVGEVVAQGLSISPGYWNLPEATVESQRNGWFHTGDLGRLDEQGYLTIVDRAKDMIIVGGENVYPREIELALATHPDVTDCAVIGIPHPVWGEEVLAFVAQKPDAHFEPRALIAHCRQLLARYKCPTRVELLPAIPRNAAGKIEKAHLREPYWAGQHKKV